MHLVRVIFLGFLLMTMCLRLFPLIDVKAVEFNNGDVHSYVNGSFTFAEDIIVTGNTTLIVENATITFSQTKNNQFGIKLSSAPSGNPHLKVKNATLTSAKSFEVILSGNSTAEFDGLTFKGSTSSAVRLEDFSKLNAYNSKIYYVNCSDFSNLSVVGSSISYVYAYDNSSIDITTSSLSRLKAYDKSLVNVTITDVATSVSAEGSATIRLDYSSLIGELSSDDNSSIILLGARLSRFSAKTYKWGRIEFINATSTPSKYAGTFILKDFSNIILSSCRLSDFIFTLAGNSTLKFENSLISSSILYSNDTSEVKIENSTVGWLFEALQNSKVLASNSSFNTLSFEDYSVGNLNKCQVGWARCYEASKIFVFNSRVTDIMLELASMNLSLSDFGSGFIENFGFSVLDFNVTLVDTYIESGWSFRFLGSSNVSLYNSNFVNLGAFERSKVYALNCSYSSLNVKDSAEVSLWSYLKVHLVDYFGGPLKSVNVSINHDGFSNSGVTDLNGDVIFELFDKRVNATGEYSAGKYGLNIVFGNGSYGYDVAMNGSQMLAYSLPSPWWYWYAIYAILIVAVIVIGTVAFLFLKRRRRGQG